ncbi:MAG TPA: hypothetical protein VFV86_09515, partial [Nitrososphaeraceae archaeon]|nr:hypothetical protein [Nitrososphaeraceae archaeon]
IKELVESYPNLKKEISNQRKVIYNLKRQNQHYGQVRNEIEYKISTANSSLQTIEYEINNKKIILENLVILEKKKSSCVYNDNFIKKIIESTVKQESWYQTTVLPLMIISFLEVIKNDPMGEAMMIDVYNINNPSIPNNVSNKKGIDIEKLSYIYYRYLPIITDINNYSKLLHKNLLQIYSFYLFDILKMSPLKKIDNQENNQNYSDKDYYNNKLFPQ